jgi:hypothetical protein
MKILDRARAWLLAPVFERIFLLATQVAKVDARVGGVGISVAQSLTHHANLAAAVSSLQAQSAANGPSISNLVYLAEKNDKARAEAEQHFNHALNVRHEQQAERAQQALEQLAKLLGTQERILLLVEPVAQRGNRSTPIVPDWDHVQAQNLEQFKE